MCWRAERRPIKKWLVNFRSTMESASPLIKDSESLEKDPHQLRERAVFKSDSEDLIVEQIEGVAKLTLNRPEARNALSSGMTRNLIEAIRWAAVDDMVRSVLITGAGLAIALCCDFRITGQKAFASTAYANIGLSGDYGIAWLLT